MQLYIHIPFCNKKCDYCDFYSTIPNKKTNIQSFFPSLLREIELASSIYSNRNITTIYIGGGTPSLLSINEIKTIVQKLKESFNLNNIQEFTIECNPESITKDFLVACRECGIDRISIGIQSLNDDNLKAINRAHNKNTALESLKLAKSYFNKVSCDIIVGLPYDTEEIIKSEISELVKYVNHFSCYELMLNPKSILYYKFQKGIIKLPGDDDIANLFDIAINELRNNGFERYEVSNFFKTHKSIHNLGYWNREEYLGFGPSAHSYVKNENVEMRFCNVESISKYIETIQNANKYPFEPINILSKLDIFEEKIFLGLRTSEGIDKTYFTDNQLLKFKDYIIDKGNKIVLNDKGFAVMDSITIELFPEK